MGDHLEYKVLLNKLRHYQRKYGRNWFRTDYMGYWRRAKHGIELRVGWRCMSPPRTPGERVLLLYGDGRVTVSCNVGMPYERVRLNHYFPFNKKWYFWWWHGALMVSRIPEGKDGYSTVGDKDAIVIDPRFIQYTTKSGAGRVRARYLEFDKDGEPVKPLKGMRFKTYKRRIIRENNKRLAPRKRGWYWTRRSRNLFRNEKGCRSNDTTKTFTQRGDCTALMRRWQRQPPQSWPCGCITYRKSYKRGFRKTVQQILNEPNATVRAAWMQIYGIQKFFEDAGSEQIDHHGQYRLLRLETGGGDSERRRIMALKMSCPTTSTIYINSVPDNISTVGQALDWMYDHRNYLGTVGQQT